MDELKKSEKSGIAEIKIDSQNENNEKQAAERAKAGKELVIQRHEKRKIKAELVIANRELVFQDKEKEKRAKELIIANKELVFQNKEKEKRAAELIIANKELNFQNKEKEKRAAELIIANEELAYQNKEKQKRASELIIANRELNFQNKEKEKRAAELIIADKELAFQNEEKDNRAKELIVANKELAFQNKEKGKRAKELIIADKQLVVANKELEKNEEELKITHERLLFHVDNTPLGYIEWDREGNPKYKSPKAEEIFGWSMKELLAGEKTAYDQVYAEDLALVKKSVKQLINGEVERNRVQNRNITKDGRVIWCEWFNSILKDKEGKVVTIMSLVQDITEQKKTEENLTQSENRFRALIERSTDMKTLSTIDGEFIYVSPSITKLFGYSLKEILNTFAFDIIHPDDIPEFAEQRKKILQTPGKSFHTRLRFLHKNGNWITCEGTVTNMLDEPGINALVSNFRDISEKISNDINREFERNNLNALINNTSDLMWSVDRDFNLITSNLPFDEMGKVNFGKTIAKGESVLSAANSPEMLGHFKELYERAFAGEVFTETEYFDFPVELWTEISYYPIRKEDKVIGTACYTRDITQRKKSEETSLRLSSIVESSRDAIISLSLKGLIVSWNHAAKILYEYSSGEIIGKPYSVLLHPHHADQFAKNVERVKAGEQPGHFESGHVLKNGKLIYVSLSISPVKDAAGHLTGISTSAHDISKHKMAEVVLKQASVNAKTRWVKRVRLELTAGIIVSLLLLFLSVFFSVPKMIYDAIGNYQDSIVDDLILMMAFSFFIGIVFVIRRFREANKGGQQVHDALRTLTKELEMRVQERTSDLSKSNEVLLNEIIERKKTEEKIIESELKYRSLIEQASDTIIVVDTKGSILEINSRAEKLFGYTRDELLEMKLKELLFDEEEDARTYEVAKGKTVVYERRVKRKDETSVDVEVSARMISDGRIFGIFRDISQRKKEEKLSKELNKNLQKQAIELTRSNEELEQFAYVTSHDLQEPLRTVTSFLTLLEKKYENIIDDKGRKYIRFAVDGSKRMQQIIQDLLEFSKVGRSGDNLEDINLNEVINEIQISFQKQINEKGAVINVGELPVINSYKIPIRQAFQNLISNALKYSRKDIPVRIRISATTLKDHWQFCIADNGIGIDSEYFDKIFIIFQRLHNKDEFSGTGIGLPVTKKIIENLGGKIWVESEEGKGSTFYFTIAKRNNKT
ncbi:MAG: PAS domain S-box protein [Ginsengibacter sp.]